MSTRVSMRDHEKQMMLSVTWFTSICAFYYEVIPKERCALNCNNTSNLSNYINAITFFLCVNIQYHILSASNAGEMLSQEDREVSRTIRNWPNPRLLTSEMPLNCPRLNASSTCPRCCLLPINLCSGSLSQQKKSNKMAKSTINELPRKVNSSTTACCLSFFNPWEFFF